MNEVIFSMLLTLSVCFSLSSLLSWLSWAAFCEGHYATQHKLVVSSVLCAAIGVLLALGHWFNAYVLDLGL